MDIIVKHKKHGRCGRTKLLVCLGNNFGKEGIIRKGVGSVNIANDVQGD
jgi:hypothetical protein